MIKIPSLKERLLDDMKTAMKNRDKAKLSVIRMARAAIKNVEIDKRKDLDDSEVMEVIAKEVKQRQSSIAEYSKLAKDDQIRELEQEIAILIDYLPKQLERKEIEKLVEKVIQSIDATSLADLGKVMGAIMPKVRGKADGGVVNTIVKEKLS